MKQDSRLLEQMEIVWVESNLLMGIGWCIKSYILVECLSDIKLKMYAGEPQQIIRKFNVHLAFLKFQFDIKCYWLD